MSSTKEEREARRTSPFADEVAEGALEIDEGAAERSVSRGPPFVPSFDVAES